MDRCHALHLLNNLPDRRVQSDRRQQQVPIGFVERRKETRRETELQAFLWATIKLQA